MAEQATRIRRDTILPKPSTTMTRNLAELGHDMMDLAELQSRLLVLDIQESLKKTQVPMGLVGLGLALALGCFPVALMGLAYLLVNAGMPFPGAFGLSALIGLIVAGSVLLVGWLRLRHSFDALQRSREELKRNMDWMRTVLKHSAEFWRSV